MDKKIIPLYDPSYNQVQWKEKSRWLVDMAATYKLLKFMDLFVRVRNLFDKDYTESGYYMPGRSIYGGVKLYF
jgi:vitamin B12 transporter